MRLRIVRQAHAGLERLVGPQQVTSLRHSPATVVVRNSFRRQPYSDAGVLAALVSTSVGPGATPCGMVVR